MIRYLLLFILSIHLTPIELFSINPENEEHLVIDKDNPERSFEEWDRENTAREKAQEDQIQQTWSKMIYILTALVVLLLFVGWLSKRFGFGRLKLGKKSDRIELVERMVISPKGAITIIRIDNLEYALYESHTTATVIDILKKEKTEDN